MSAEHVPVMEKQVLQLVRDMAYEPRFFMDTTFGRGGHTQMFLKEYPEALVVALDRDGQAVAYGREHLASWVNPGRLYFYQSNYNEVDTLLETHNVPCSQFDVIFMDLGVSSPQLEDADRGFSFYRSGPLDMRMDKSQELKASDIINTWSFHQLKQVFQEWGEVRKPARVIRALEHDRQQKNFETTDELAGLIERVEGWRKKGQHPATKYFLALRLAVNEELNHLQAALPKLIQNLNEGGRLIVITFHSLEDRLVKNTFRESRSQGFPVNKKVIRPEEQEIQNNPRSRSAKLRAFQREARHE